MEMKIMWAGAMVLGGFLWSYLFARQLIFNILIAHPLIKKMNSLQPDLISVGAVRYTWVSNVVCVLLGGILLFVVIHFCPLYLILSFAFGAVVAIILIMLRTKPANKDMFDAFSNAYCRFIPDDELRTIMYNKQYDKVKARLKNMGIRDTFVPKLNKQSK